MSTIISQLGTVSFQGHNLTVITTNSDERFVAMKPICEAIGLSWSGQYERIQRHEVLKTCVRVTRTEMPGDDQHRELVCLPLDYLNGWLFGVDASRVKPEPGAVPARMLRRPRHLLAAGRGHKPARDPTGR